MKLPRLSLTTRIFLSSAGILIAVMAVTLVLTQRSAEQAAEQSIGQRLETTEQRVKAQLAAERRVLAGRLAEYGSSPTYRSNVDGENADFQDFVETAVDQTGATWAQFIDRDGVLQARSDMLGVPKDTLAGFPLVQTALGGDVGEGFGSTGDSVLVQYVTVPVTGAGNRIIGVLMGARFVEDSIVAALRDQTGSELLFFVLDRNDEPRRARATPRADSAAAVLLARASRSIHGDSGVTQAGAPGGDSSATLEHADVGGEDFVLRHATLERAGGDPVGGFVALRSLDEELRVTGFTRLRQTLLFAGAGGVLLALLVGAFTARRVVRPVTLLANATRRAAEGDYAAEIPEGGSDEIGTLASNFRRLLADLKDKQALVDFLSVASGPGGTRTQVINPNAPTMKLPVGMENITVLTPGQTFGNRYEIKSVLGVGGMGMVYKANDKELGEILAIKTLKPEMVAADSNALERFKSEIKLARRIAHRNVVRTYDLGEIGGLYYISMEYVEGKSLKDLIRERGRLPASAVLPIAKQLCRALEVSHDEGVIHRDIKPQNMVVQADGVLKVMDFGIARLATRPKGDAGHTEAGMVVGTPEYMAPEQLMGDELDARADLYATGVVLYECLTGNVPITADTPITLIAKVLEEEPKPVKAVQPDVPQALSDLVMWVLAKERDKRPRSAAELHSRLDAIALS